MRLFNLERVEQLKTRYQNHYANDADELERYGLKKSKTHVAKLGALNPEPVSGMNLMMEFSQVVYDRLSDETLENDEQALFEKVSSYGRSFITMKVQAVDDEGNKVSLDESVSRMKCGHLGNMPVGVSKSFPLYETKEFKTARPNVSNRLKVYDFIDFDNQG